MSKFNDTVYAELDVLRAARDHLKVRMHLGEAELRDRWTEAEVKWNRIEGEWKRLTEKVEAPTDEVKHGFNAMLADLGEAYSRMRTAIERAV